MEVMFRMGKIMSGSLHSIMINNKRDLRLFLWYLSARDIAVLVNKLSGVKGIYSEGDIFGRDVRIASLAINQALILIKDKEKKSVYSLSFDFFKSLQLSPSDFSWIKKSSDACYFTWLYIRSQVHDCNALLQPDLKVVSKLRNENYPAGKHDFMYNKLQLTTFPVDNKERIVAIEDFFDRAPASIRSKLNLMHYIRSQWEHLYHLSSEFPLSPRDKKKCEWAWGYINKDRSGMNTRKKMPDGSLSDVLNAPSITEYNMLSMLRPSGSYEKYMAVKFSHIFNFVKDERFIQRFRKAWEVHVYRTSANARKKKNMVHVSIGSPGSESAPDVSLGLDLTDYTNSPLVDEFCESNKNRDSLIQSEPTENEYSLSVDCNQERTIEPEFHQPVHPYNRSQRSVLSQELEKISQHFSQKYSKKKKVAPPKDFEMISLSSMMKRKMTEGDKD